MLSISQAHSALVHLQAGIPKKSPVEKFQSKINNIQDKLGIPFLFLACYEKTEKRKPFPVSKKSCVCPTRTHRTATRNTVDL